MEIRNNTNQAFGSKVILPPNTFRNFQNLSDKRIKSLNTALNKLEKNGNKDTVALEFQEVFGGWEDSFTMTVLEKRGKDLYIGAAVNFPVLSENSIGRLYKAARADMSQVKEKPNCLLKFFV